MLVRSMHMTFNSTEKMTIPLSYLCSFAVGDKPAAIVTAVAGTTRDVVEQYISIGGYPLSLADTAGIREDGKAIDPVEKEGIVRARQFAKSADVILLVVDAIQFLDWLVCQEISEDFMTKYIKKHIMHLGLQDANEKRHILKKYNQSSTQ